MGSRGRPKQALTLTDDEREVLARWSRRPKSPHSLAQRSRIVLECASGADNVVVAAKLDVNQATVSKWRRRFIELRLDGLVDEPRPGAPRTISDDDVERVIVRTLEDKPADATQWSTRDLAAKVGMSASSVGRIWQAFGLKPWLIDTFKLSEDPMFVEKVRDVVGLYINPPEHAVVLCVDEKTSIQALDRTQPSLPMRPGQIERRTHDYVRHGVTDLFAALNLATGQVTHQTRSRHRAIEFRKFLDAIDDAVPAELDVHVVLDNSSTHKTPAIHRWLLRHPRFTFHFTPTSSSWLNLVERWFAELTRKLLQRSAHRSVAALTVDLDRWIETWNNNPRPFVWHKTADEILDNLKKYLVNL
ncbi:MAG: IS630 family transposase [Ilumatobacteraceae bacterium]|jgi:transposase|nr:IS630 family transposase [Ilumatobacteraceae bacterium]